MNIPKISAKYWAVYDANKFNIIYGKKELIKRECASLTKIMTCYLVIKLCNDWNFDMKKIEIKVSDIASDIRGTTANLETGDILSIE
jgi:D-alanyl-D-alanine carboxypeptidase